MVWMILSLIVVGAIAGFIARAVVPGRDAMGIGGTILLGIVGSFVGGFLASLLFNSGSGDLLRPSGLIGSFVGALLLTLAWGWYNKRRASA